MPDKCPVDFTSKEFYFDVKITSSDEKVFYFSRFVLIAASEYFRNLLANQFTENSADEITLEYSGNVVHALLRYLNPGSDEILKELLVNSDNVFDLLEISHATELTSLFVNCVKFISNNMSDLSQIYNWSLIANKLIEYHADIKKHNLLDKIYKFYADNFEIFKDDLHLEKVKFEALKIVSGNKTGKYIIIFEKWVQYGNNIQFTEEFIYLMHTHISTQDKLYRVLKNISEKITDPKTLLLVIKTICDIYEQYKTIHD